MKKILKYERFYESINLDSERLLKKIDYTLLKPDATKEDIIKLCEKADILGVKSVCVLPKMVHVARQSLKDSDVLVCTVVSFPHGTDTTEDKKDEALIAITAGADEVDMVLDYPMLKKRSWDAHEDIYLEIQDLVNICHSYKNKNGEKVVLKVIVESGLLTDKETEIATECCIDGGADFIKTSTGMVSVGAELEKVKIMKNVINEHGSKMKIKASGGIRTIEDIKKFDFLVDRFGVGFASVDTMFGGQEKTESDY